jgi:hypothetical protein
MSVFFLHQPFRSRLPAAGASFNLSGACFLRLALLLSASQEHTSCGWRFFQPFKSTLLSTGVSLSLSGADCLRLTLLLSASQQQTSFGWRFFWLAHVSLLRFRRPTAWS